MANGQALPREAVVAVIGAGAMGAGIAQIAAQAGHRVLLFDARTGAADDATRRLGATFDTLASKGRMSAEDARSAAARIEPVHTPGACVSARLVVEAIVEDAVVKRELFGDLERIVAADAILASNTSSLSITALAAGMKVPGRVAGLHFFNPAPLMPLVEIVRGLATDPAVADTLFATAAAWGKTPVHATSTPGFIVNRCARPFYAEALRLAAERAADGATIDAVMREAGGFRMGPFELMDLIGLDVNYAVSNSVYNAYFQDPRFKPSLIQQEMVAAGYLGRKSGRGFFAYGDSNRSAAPPAPAAEPARAFSGKVIARGALRLLGPLVERLHAAGVAIETLPAETGIGAGYLQVGECVVLLTDGRTATAHAAQSNFANLVKLDLAFDYAKATRCAVTRADQCFAAGFDNAVGLLQAGGLAVSRLDDAPALAVMRTVAMLANEAADAVHQGVCSAGDCDTGMQKGVNYPRGPLAWADAIGIDTVVGVLDNLCAHYGEDRYRVSPLLRRKLAAGGSFHG